ncbi:MAG: hypothetical protein WCF12_13495 [Propionicimonas sp.]
MSVSEVPKSTVMLFRAATLFTLLAVAMGSVVCATESGFECGNWPGCTDSALLPTGQVATFLYRNPWIEMIHRITAILAGPLALAAGILAVRLKHVNPLVRVLPWVTVVGAIIAGVFGRMAVLGLPFPVWGGAADLAAALVAMGAMVVATVALERTPSAWFTSKVGTLSWLSLALLVAMHLVSLFAAGPGSYTRCLSWPVWDLIAADRAASGALQVARFVLSVLAAGAILATFALARRQASLKRPATAVAQLLGVVLAFGFVIRQTGSDDLGVLFSLATVALLWTLTLLGALASLETVPDAAPGSFDESRPAAAQESPTGPVS